MYLFVCRAILILGSELVANPVGGDITDGNWTLNNDSAGGILGRTDL